MYMAQKNPPRCADHFEVCIIGSPFSTPQSNPSRDAVSHGRTRTEPDRSTRSCFAWSPGALTICVVLSILSFSPPPPTPPTRPQPVPTGTLHQMFTANTPVQRKTAALVRIKRSRCMGSRSNIRQRQMQRQMHHQSHAHTHAHATKLAHANTKAEAKKRKKKGYRCNPPTSSQCSSPRVTAHVVLQ